MATRTRRGGTADFGKLDFSMRKKRPGINRTKRGGTADFGKLDFSMRRRKEKPALSKPTPIERPRRPIGGTGLRRGIDMNLRKPGGQKNHQYYPAVEGRGNPGWERRQWEKAKKLYGEGKSRKPTTNKPSPKMNDEQRAAHKKKLSMENQMKARPGTPKMKFDRGNYTLAKKGPSYRGFEKGKRLGTLKSKVGSRYQTGGRPQLKSKYKTAKKSYLNRRKKVIGRLKAKRSQYKVKKYKYAKKN